MNMDISVLLLAFTMLWESTNAMLCYRCIAERGYAGTNVPLCQNFDYSEKFVVECSNSTGCVKKETELLSLGVKTRSIERGCAPQTMEGYQEFINGQWVHVNKIHEAYEVECREDPSEFDKPSKGTYCFCRGNLCNGANLAKSSISLIFVTILWASVADR